MTMRIFKSMTNPKPASAAALLFATMVFFADVALAAPLNYPTNASILLTSPSVTLTVVSGSLADGLVVNATSVAVTISASTGGTFTLTSPQALASSTTGSGGTLTQTCSGGIETDTITQSGASEIYTLTPTGSACVTGGLSPAPSSSPSVSVPSSITYVAAGSMGTGPASSVTSSTSTITTATSSAAVSSSSPTGDRASLRAELQSLEAELNVLLAEAGQSGSSSISSTPAFSSSFVFTRNLQLGMTGNDVKQLQLFLVAQNKGPAARALKTHGVTQNFASLTKAALIEFQRSVGIKPASGYFGPVTRAWVNAHE